MFYTNKEELTFDDIKEIIKKHDAEIVRYQKLQKEYKNESSKARIKNSFAKYITDVLVGYFMGNPVVYKSDNAELLKRLQDIFNYSDEQEENYELAKMASVNGIAYELLYTDENGQIRFNEIDPIEIFVIKKASLDDIYIAAVRKYKIDKTIYLEWYSADSAKYYQGEELDKMKLVDEKMLVFGDVPVVIYENNKELKGDFEDILTHIEAYNIVQSNTLQDMEDFTDAFLALVNYGGTNTEDTDKLKKDKILLLDSDGDAKWLIKNVNDTWVENFKDRLKRDIHKLSFTPDLTDENFAQNASGVSLKYKLIGMEQLRGIKERKFKKGLQRRIELICNALKIKTGKDAELDLFTDIEMVFSDALPQNILEISQIISNLAPFLSQETLTSQVPFVENAKEEIDRKKKEEKELISDEYEEEQRVLEKQK